ncbi:prolyl oligopeptidase family serine peptidase [Deinococcus radiotolerans]|uniref:prolyl oligopeptidase family serine peptidase n=1 Tax=Deinococcus radiotolerans TaxID=1309407 RepID=UPI001E428D8A|nr:prolyl oligopeptidase family serine peptidase [Deinococcus radiotolerans]
MTHTAPPSVPVTRRDAQTDTYLNAQGEAVVVADPYRWLEDPDHPDTRAWVQAQSAHAQAHLGALPARDAYHERLSSLWNHVRPGVPWARGERYFRMFNPGLLNQPLLQVAPDPHGPWETLLDPNALSADGTVAMAEVSVSRDGQHLAYATQSGGSDWLTWRVRDIASRQDRPDELHWSKFSSAAWHPDGHGFYYSAYDAPAPGGALTAANSHQRLMFHRLGEPQAQDEPVIVRPDQPTWGYHARVTEDARFLIVQVWNGTDPRNLLWIRPLDEAGAFTELVAEFRAMYSVSGSDGDTLFVHTDEDAPRGQVIAWTLGGDRRTVIPEGPDKLEEVHVVPGGLLTLTLKDASHRLHLHGRDGTPQREVPLPTLGTLSLSTHASSPEVFYGFTSFLHPNQPYRVQLPGGTPEPLAAEALTFNPEDFEVTQDFAVSRDGTRVPLFIVARRGLPRTGTHPTLLYGYGGFNISLTPAFNAGRVAWLERGGIYVQANLRGGGEYGQAWHQAGTLHRKQNVFDDFIACAEHLIAQGWTSPTHLGIQGGSNGGLLVGACLTQRPDLFGAAVPQVGVLDMLRYHQFTIGWAWASDYGRSDDPQLLPTLLAYSPLHTLRPGTAYPPTLITTGDHDDRVVPAHSFKFGAALQHAQGGPAPILLRIQTQAGHGAGKPTDLIIEEQADLYAFLEAHLRHAAP